MIPPLLVPDWQAGHLEYTSQPPLVDLWLMPLRHITPEPELLSQQERVRAMGQSNPETILALRTAQRRILASYLGLAPAQLVFTRTAKGKPYLTNSNLRFNLSHSQDMAVLAVSVITEVGVDLEWPRPLQHMDQIASRCFEPQIAAFLRSLPDPGQKQMAFTQVWVCLEARQKLGGEGLFGKGLVPEHQLWLYALDTGGFCALTLAQGDTAVVEPRLWHYPN